MPLGYLVWCRNSKPDTTLAVTMQWSRSRRRCSGLQLQQNNLMRQSYSYLDTFWNPGQVLETTSEGMSEFYSESVEKKSAVLMKMFANTLI